MITIKKCPYNKAEQLALYAVFDAAVGALLMEHCKAGVKCQTCQYRHLCADLMCARDYCEKIREEVKTK